MKNQFKDNFSIYKWFLPIGLILWPFIDKVVTNQNIIFVVGLIAITFSFFIIWVGESNKLKFGKFYILACVLIILFQFIWKFIDLNIT